MMHSDSSLTSSLFGAALARKPALRQAERQILPIARQHKLDEFQQATTAEPGNAISKLANDKGVGLDVYWCA
jgi:6-phosphogluconolactonase